MYTELGSLFRAMKPKGKINKHSICIGASKQPALLQLAFAWLPSRDHMACLITMSGRRRHHNHFTGKGSLSKSFKWHLAIKLSSPGALKAMPHIMSIWRRGFYALSHLDTSRHQDISWLASHSGPSSASRSANVTGLSATGRPGSCLDSISTSVARLSVQNEWVMEGHDKLDHPWQTMIKSLYLQRWHLAKLMTSGSKELDTLSCKMSDIDPKLSKQCYIT